MSVESSRAFLRVAYDSPELKQQLKAVTGTREIVRLGLRYGYTFDVPELMEASSSFAERPERPGPARPATTVRAGGSCITSTGWRTCPGSRASSSSSPT
jgi:hypothetical protein